MKRPLDLAAWPRREHFGFFRHFSEPFFGVTVELRCEGLYRAARDRSASFYLAYLHATLQAVNAVDALALRIEGDTVWQHDRVDVSATVHRDDGTFGFSYIPYDADFDLFSEHARAEIARVRSTSGLAVPQVDAAVVHASAVPWLQFTALSHARQHNTDDASPKIAFGKLFQRHGARHLPISIHVHHAVADGLHVGQVVDDLQRRLDP
ncbi:MAG: chloramphenicol acetyltransferase [Deltaproteobacteria bacterium]|nr:chloramphenicol acetyltransferase [Deltaproteobacteria bacterium]